MTGDEASERAKQMGWDDDPHECPCEHNVRDTGGVFFYSAGIILCTICKGWQKIRKDCI